MKNDEFKKLFDEVAKNYRFECAFSGWFKESDECILALGLQKSNFSNIYYLNIKTYIHDLFGNTIIKVRILLKKKWEIFLEGIQMNIMMFLTLIRPLIILNEKKG